MGRQLARFALLGVVFFCVLGKAATFGTMVPIVGGASDLVLDEARSRLYLVNTNSNRIEVYSLAQRRFLTPVNVDTQPLAAAMSRSGRALYVTAHTGGALNVIDLETLQVVNRVSLPARPEGVAVGGDDRVLISTVGTGTGNQLSILLIYDPSAPAGTQALSAVPIAPPPPANPLLPPQNFGRPGLTNRSFLATSQDGNWIVGVNIPTTTDRAVFVYEVASGTVLRSRRVNGVSSVLSVSPNGDRFMAGLTLFDTATLTVLAQQNTANAPYPFAAGINFNLQQNQGGSAFSTDGARLYSAFNFAPVQTPAARANVSQLMVNDPDNLLINGAYQMPENVAGKMVLSRDGANLYALSESGFLIVPLGAVSQSPLAAVDTTVALVANDQCGVTADRQIQRINVRNEGRGRLTAQAFLLQQTGGAGGIGGAGGAGGGAPGGGVIIVVPPIALPPGVELPPGVTLPGGVPTGQNAAVAATAPRQRVINTAEGSTFEFTFNTTNRGIGTVTPVHSFVVQSNEAVNIPPAVRVLQNNRNSEARGEVMPVPLGLTASEGLVDMVHDQPRGRLYIANSGLNRIEIFDTRAQRFLPPLKAGQLPRSVALSPDGQTMYVANSGGESISIVDVERMEVVGRVRFPATPFNSNVTLVTPQVVAVGQRGPLVIMNNGTIWRIVGNEAVPRRFNEGVIPLTGGQQVLTAPRTMAASPGGEVVLAVAGNGNAYLYDAMLDDFIQARQITAGAITGFYGPVSVGPRGQYFQVNGQVLNQSLTPVTVGPGGADTRPIAAVVSVGATQIARFVQPTIANANAVATLTDAGTVEVVDLNTGAMLRQSSALERPLATVVGNQRTNTDGRMLAVDLPANRAYALTASGLSVIPLDPVSTAARPVVPANAVVNVGSYLPQLAPGGLISIFGRNLGEQVVASSAPWPTRLGGMCVTLNNSPIPLMMTSPGQINAQIPTTLAAGRYPLVVRSLDTKLASTTTQLQVVRYAPAVLVDTASGIAAVFHADGRPVTKDNPAKRDRPITLYAVGLGVTKPVVAPGAVAPASPLAEIEDVQVFFGDTRYNGSEIIVDWAGLVPGYIGLYQINLRVPGYHLRGDALPVTVRLGGVSSPSTGPAVPTIAVD
ncbi:MAG: hypothetical protein JNN08_19825 [Bryobacterales bacterium]|nr:hypothetical protein [Bryobacterales bacterium]